MLNVLQRGESYSAPCVLLLGGFDGIHIGHQTLVEAGKAFSCPVGLTSFYGGKQGGDIFTPPEREYLYGLQGLSFSYQIPFTDELKNTSAEDFLRELTGAFSLRAVVCGSDFRFGKGASGDSALLKRTLNCPVLVKELTKIGGEKVSSSQIKKMLSEGDTSAVNVYLAHPYLIMGRVERGRSVGKGLGFPTLNLSISTEKYPLRDGVYGGYVQTERGEFPAVINYGARPTFGVEERKIEAYLVGFEGDLYGTQVRVFPTEYLRPVQKFESVEELCEQVKRDIGRLRK